MDKNWWQSKTVWAQVVGVVATMLALFGVDVLDAETQAGIVAGAWAVVNVVLRLKTDKAIK